MSDEARKPRYRDRYIGVQLVDRDRALEPLHAARLEPMQEMALENFHDRLCKAIVEDPPLPDDERICSLRTRVRSLRAVRSCLAKLEELGIFWREDGHWMCAVARLELDRRERPSEGRSPGVRSEFAGNSLGIAGEKSEKPNEINGAHPPHTHTLPHQKKEEVVVGGLSTTTFNNTQPLSDADHQALRHLIHEWREPELADQIIREMERARQACREPVKYELAWRRAWLRNHYEITIKWEVLQTARRELH